jgi:hypothetical protein
VKVLYDEDVASHIGPEPCVMFREGHGEASAGECVGWVLSRESTFSRTPTRCGSRKATRTVALSRATARPGVVRDPSTHRRSLPGNREISLLAGGVARRRSARGRPDGRSPR